MPVCIEGRGGISFLSISSGIFFKNSKTSKRELIDCPIDSPMDASNLLSAK